VVLLWRFPGLAYVRLHAMGLCLHLQIPVLYESRCFNIIAAELPKVSTVYNAPMA
jgi:hypothetical protein